MPSNSVVSITLVHHVEEENQVDEWYAEVQCDTDETICTDSYDGTSRGRLGASIQAHDIARKEYPDARVVRLADIK